MSFLTGGSKKSQFYVEFLGWMECRGLKGRKFVDPVISELRRRQRKVDTPPRLTIQVSRKELKISQDIEDSKKRTIKKIKFPTIPARDVTYVYNMKSSDVVACIYLGYMPRTQRFVHVHVYRFDSVETATTFATQMSQMVEGNMSRIREIEIDLANKGEIEDPRLSSSDGMSDPHTTDSVESAVGSTSSNCSDDDPRINNRFDIDPDLQSLADVQPFDNVAEELKYRLQIKESPLLLPPKDYDTISRAHGNLAGVNLRRCLNLDIVGENAIGKMETRARNSSTESGVDLNSPSTTASDRIDGDMIPGHQQLAPNNSFTLNDSFRSSGPSTPGTPPVDQQIIYPPKPTSPPMSPQVAHLRTLNRQNSHSSFQSESSKHSHHSEGADSNDENVIIYKGAPQTGDIYAQPIKRKAASMHNTTSNNYANTNFLVPNSNFVAPSNKFVAPNSNFVAPNNPNVGASISPRVDYHGVNEEANNLPNGDVQMRSPGPRFRQQTHLTRSMPADLIRSEMALSANSPRQSRDSRELIQNHVRRPNSPSFVGQNQYIANPYPGQEYFYGSSGRLNTYR